MELKKIFPARYWIPVVLFVSVLATGAYLVSVNYSLHQKDQNLSTQQLLSAHAARIQQTLTHNLAATYTLAQEVARSNGEFKHFDQYAKRLLHRAPSISSLQLAREGIVSDVYPLAGNEPVLGHNILTDPTGFQDREVPFKARELTLAGPLELLQGGVGVIGRNPVYLDAGAGEEFWGFTTVVILLEDLLAQSGLSSISQELDAYEVGRFNPNNFEEEIFAGKGDLKTESTREINISVPNGTWFLRVSRLKSEGLPYRNIGYLLSFLVALMVSILSCRVLDEPANLRKLVAVQTQDLHHLAYTDCLTNLPNRLYFSEHLDRAIDKQIGTRKPLTLLLLDLDRFKEVNDTLGHDAGDLLLIEAAQRISWCLPEGALLARLGGDEFVIVLDSTNEAARPIELANLIIDALNHPFTLKLHQVYVSASIGVAPLTKEILCATDLLKCADQAMYDAKNRGRNRFSFYSPGMHALSVHRMRLANDLRSALAKNELELAYQPIVCNKSGKVVKAEALLRWHHPELGSINPPEFIAIAEEFGLIMEIGEWAFCTAAHQVKQWRENNHPDFQVSVNVSPLQLRSERHTQQCIKCLNAFDLPGDSILIELTEGVLLDDSSDTRKQMTLLRDAGIKLALDDFGTGYSSLSYLKLFDIDVLKIDQSFVSNLEPGNDDMVLCEAIIAIANKLGLEVVAEGVETVRQHELLAQENCDYSQGFLFSKPISAKRFELQFLSHSNSAMDTPVIAVA